MGLAYVSRRNPDGLASTKVNKPRRGRADEICTFSADSNPYLHFASYPCIRLFLHLA